MTLTDAVKWSFFSELAAKAIQPVVFIILARLLTPEDFGVTSAALMVIGFSQIFWEAGLGKAVIQRQTDFDEATNAAFLINIGLGLVIAGLLFSAADSIAQVFFHDVRVSAVLQVMTVQIILGAVSAIHIAILQKELGFKALFWVRFATVSLPGLASIPLAIIGMGYWALVAGTLAGQMAQVVMLWRMSSWRPRWLFDAQVAKELGRFGVWVGATGLLTWFYAWGDSLIVGMYLGSHDLGLYRTGNQLAIMVFSILFGPIVPVLYSHLSRMNQDLERIRNATRKVIKVLTVIAIPIAMIVFSLSVPIGDALFGNEWQGIGLIIGVMSLSHGFAWVVGLNGEVYRAMGKPSYETIVPATTLAVYVAAYFSSIHYGLEIFLWTRFGLALGGIFLHLIFLRKLLEISVRSIMNYMLAITIICGSLVYLVQHILAGNIIGSWGQLLIGGFMSVAAVAAAVFFLERNGILKDLMAMFRRHAI